MSALTRDSQIKTGLLSKALAAELAGVSRPVIIKLCQDKKIPIFKPIGIREWRIPALDLMLFLIEDENPFPADLAKAALNYAHSMQPGHLTYAREVYRTFGISPKQRKAIQFIPDNPLPTFDGNGDVVVVDSEIPST